MDRVMVVTKDRSACVGAEVEYVAIGKHDPQAWIAGLLTSRLERLPVVEFGGPVMSFKDPAEILCASCSGVSRLEVAALDPIVNHDVDYSPGGSCGLERGA